MGKIALLRDCVTIQSNLKWDAHCKQVAAKASNTLNVLKVIKHSIFRNLKAFLYGEEHQMYLCNIPVFMSSQNLVKVVQKEVFERPEKKIFWRFSD